jgi:hypothetical protein
MADAALLFTSAYVANDTTLATLQLLPGCIIFSMRRTTPQDRRHPNGGGEAHLAQQRSGRPGSQAQSVWS